MKLYRFMSLREFCDMLNGKEIVGRKSFPKYATTSRGICFTADPQDIIDLSGIVSNGVCVEFECKEKLTKSTGLYYSGVKEEYCTASYNNSILKPLRYAPATVPFEEKRSRFADVISLGGYQPVSFDWYDISLSEIVPPEDDEDDLA